MAEFEIHGGRRLSGQVLVSGAKNATLPIMAASLLTADVLSLKNVPELQDVTTLCRLLEAMGVRCEAINDQGLELCADTIETFEASYDLVKTMRASILVLGPLVARFGEAKVALPGGCSIGSRPVDLHIAGLQAMGAQISIEAGYICAKVDGRLKGARILFETVTVTGTENLLMAAVLADGVSTLENAACEPEVTDLAHCLVAMGADIQGIGTDTLVVRGVEALHGAEHSIVADRIEAGTFLVAGAATCGDVRVNGVQPSHLDALLIKLQEAGMAITRGNDWVRCQALDKRPQAVSIKTAPYPAFPTDMQAQFMVLNTIATGAAQVTENIFENRFMHVDELRRLGASITVEGHTAFVQGVGELRAAPIVASDLRASACLVIAGLVAKGVTRVDAIHHIDRGYDAIEKKLQQLGAVIERVSAHS